MTKIEVTPIDSEYQATGCPCGSPHYAPTAYAARQAAIECLSMDNEHRRRNPANRRPMPQNETQTNGTVRRLSRQKY